MERREHEVTRQRRIDSEARRLFVADFTHHYYVWVLAHEGAQPSAEGKSNVRSHLSLIHSLHLIFDRVFYRGDVNVWRI